MFRKIARKKIPRQLEGFILLYVGISLSYRRSPCRSLHSGCLQCRRSGKSKTEPQAAEQVRVQEQAAEREQEPAADIEQAADTAAERAADKD